MGGADGLAFRSRKHHSPSRAEAAGCARPRRPRARVCARAPPRPTAVAPSKPRVRNLHHPPAIPVCRPLALARPTGRPPAHPRPNARARRAGTHLGEYGAPAAWTVDRAVISEAVRAVGNRHRIAVLAGLRVTSLPPPDGPLPFYDRCMTVV